MGNDIKLEETATTKEQDGGQQGKSFLRQVMETVAYFIVIFLVVLLVQRFLVQPVEVNGSSMEPTLHNNNHVLLEKVSYSFSEPKRFDVIVFQPYEEEKELYYIKRVIGLPGERVQIADSVIYINGERLDENYGLENEIKTAGIAGEEVVLKDGEYFVLGDNRNNSKDSRDPSVGIVRREAILGRAWCTIWPFQDFGVVKHK